MYDENLPLKRCSAHGEPENDWQFIIDTGYQSSLKQQPVVATDANGQTWIFEDRKHPRKVEKA